MFGSVTPSSLTRRSIVSRACDDGLLAHLLRDVRPHREVVGAAGAGIAVVVGAGDVVGDAAELGVAIRGTPSTRNDVGDGHGERVDVDAGAPAAASRSCSPVVVVEVCSASSVWTRSTRWTPPLQVEAELQLPWP